MDPFVGEVRIFGGNFAPVGWAMCNGQLLSISEYDVLFMLLGTTYGGDGQTTFGVPSLCGRAAVGIGQGPGLSNYIPGQMGGSESVTLTTSQLGSHGHAAEATLGVTSAAAAAPSPTNNLFAKGADSVYSANYTGSVTTSPDTVSANTTPTGGNQPHANMQPSLAVNYIIATQGIYPSQQ